MDDELMMCRMKDIVQYCLSWTSSEFVVVGPLRSLIVTLASYLLFNCN